MTSYKYKLVISYDGTQYCGWQVQPNGVSIQSKIQEALEIILRQKIKVVGSGRTDAGVHALGQVAHFTSTVEIEVHRFLLSINALIPVDIRVKSIEKVLDSFHARYSSTKKIYHYHMLLGPVCCPFKRHYAYHWRGALDVDYMREGARLFLGTHDFKSFAYAAHEGVAAYDSIRTIYRLDLVQEANSLRFEFEGDGFLYKMVRNIVGTLLDLGTRKRTLDYIERLFLESNRSKAGTTAPGHGLFLVEVIY
ncbi:MAG: tRNA pseudouridine synthase [Chlamydiales bacterium]|nr:tRNA pseudouridine synthase [Chlamydiales bacterium]